MARSRASRGQQRRAAIDSSLAVRQAAAPIVAAADLANLRSAAALVEPNALDGEARRRLAFAFPDAFPDKRDVPDDRLHRQLAIVYLSEPRHDMSEKVWGSKVVSQQVTVGMFKYRPAQANPDLARVVRGSGRIGYVSPQAAATAERARYKAPRIRPSDLFDERGNPRVF